MRKHSSEFLKITDYLHADCQSFWLVVASGRAWFAGYNSVGSLSGAFKSIIAKPENISNVDHQGDGRIHLTAERSVPP